MKRVVSLVALSALVALFVAGALTGFRPSAGIADATSFVAITNQEAATLFGAGCGPAQVPFAQGCTSPNCRPQGMVYNQPPQGSSNWVAVPNDCQSVLVGGGTCGGWDDLQQAPCS